MKATATTTQPPLATLQTRWQSLAARERRMLALAAATIVCALLWWLALAPALQTLRQYPAASAQLDAQLQRMQALRQQAQTLQQAQDVAITAAAATRSLQTHTPQLLGASAQLNITGDRATVRFANVPAADLAQWLTQMRESARAMPLQAEIARSAGSEAGSSTRNGHKAGSGAGAETGAGAGAADAKASRWSGVITLALPEGGTR